jgi:hypothetical protein
MPLGYAAELFAALAADTAAVRGGLADRTALA